ncbi:MAG: HAMP domain-containing protein [Leptospirales bacterium]|nr:HAMP domain-containing protein [Leptospirales bacterium]
MIEVSSKKMQTEILYNIKTEYKNNVDFIAGDVSIDESKVDYRKLFGPIFTLRNRIILLLIVVVLTILCSLVMFAKDIVNPMDGMVDATRKIVDGDLTVKVPVMTEDEIGQIATLINDMNAKILDMIDQLKQDIGRHKDNVTHINELIMDLIPDNKSDEIVVNKKMRLSEFRKVIVNINQCALLLEDMNSDLSSLQTFINMYKTYSVTTDISDDEIFSALEAFKAQNEGR